VDAPNLPVQAVNFLSMPCNGWGGVLDLPQRGWGGFLEFPRRGWVGCLKVCRATAGVGFGAAKRVGLGLSGFSAKRLGWGLAAKRVGLGLVPRSGWVWG
jgi:hypothetical protein